VIVNGPLGNHGACILLQRGSFGFKTDIESDCAPLNRVIEDLLERFDGIRFMRDLTRGGFATNTAETAISAHIDIRIDESSIPVDDSVWGVATMLGLDPLYLANEGKFMAIVSENQASQVVAHLRQHHRCEGASVVGTVTGGKGNTYLTTGLGGTRRLNLLAGAPLPRIC
jgi:hydrogenase expression/formation protein HypE